MTLAEFLLARIVEDEALATGGWVEANLDEMPTDLIGTLFDPRVVVDECRAKRDLIEWALAIEYLREVSDPQAPRRPLGDEVLRMLALPFSAHPDYQPEWAPE